MHELPHDRHRQWRQVLLQLRAVGEPQGRGDGGEVKVLRVGARTQYPKGTWHRVEITMFDVGEDCSQTNVLKRARYWIEGEKE